MLLNAGLTPNVFARQRAACPTQELDAGNQSGLLAGHIPAKFEIETKHAIPGEHGDGAELNEVQVEARNIKTSI
jgi:hypothetical protein